jgi:hypothetical protein
MNYFNTLPQSIHILIYQYVSPIEIIKVKQTSKLNSRIIQNNKDILWTLIYFNSKKPKIKCKDKSYNYQWTNYTMSLYTENLNLENNFKIAMLGYQQYLLKNNI